MLLKISLAAFAAATSLLSPVNGSPSGPLTARAPTTSKKVIIQMFEWTWDSVAAECTAFIGPAGYGFVQGKCISLSASYYY